MQKQLTAETASTDSRFGRRSLLTGGQTGFAGVRSMLGG